MIVDCDHDDGNEGCNGGLAYTALQWIQRGHKLESRSDYVYTAQDGVCQEDKYEGLVGVAQVNLVTPRNLSQTLAAVANGPVGISVAAGNDYFRYYQSGVLTNPACGTALDHAIAIVGYGTDASLGVDYWIVRNSWGAGWGEEGYIRLGRVEGDGVCGCQIRPVWA
jgi:C1A family cysteine protease